MSKIPFLQLNEQSITKLQYITIMICFLMNVLDGMDVLIISYCAPAIATSWQIGPEALGIVFSVGLAGMALGALVIAPYADHIGRKKMILISAFLMGTSVFCTGFAQTVPQLMLLRLLSGLGIGSMLATTASLTSEYLPNRSKDFWVSFVLAGYPIGAIIVGYVAASVIPVSGWRMMFKLAGIASLVTIPVIFFFLSESIEFYLSKQPRNALQKVNRILEKLKVSPLSELPNKSNRSRIISVDQLLSNTYRISTLKLWTALFFAFGCLYFLISWIPKLATNAGLSMELAIYSGTVFNVGAFFGIVVQGYISSKIGLKKTIAFFLGTTAFLMAIFNDFVGSDFILLIFGLLGFTLQGGFVGLYAVAARLYPAEFRTTGVGWAIGAGRLGGVLGPALGGILIGWGLSMSSNFMIFAVPAFLAGVVTYFISSKEIP